LLDRISMAEYEGLDTGGGVFAMNRILVNLALHSETLRIPEMRIFICISYTPLTVYELEIEDFVKHYGSFEFCAKCMRVVMIRWTRSSKRLRT
jgi:hypothetical protein